MNKLLSFTALMALFATSFTFAASLEIPLEFEYVALDGKTIETNHFSHQSTLNLQKGIHKIAIRYNDVVEDEFSDSHSFVKSAPFIVTLTVTQKGKYKLKPANGMIRSPKKFAKNPQVIIASTNQPQVQFSVKQSQIEDKHFLSNLFSNGNADNLQLTATEMTSLASTGIKTVNDQAVNNQAVNNQTRNINHNSSNASNTSTSMSEQMLKHWWLQANKVTREEFIRWAKTQP